MRISAAAYRLASVGLVSLATWLGGAGVAHADSLSCSLSDVGQMCPVTDGGIAGLTCLAVTTTTTAEDGGMSNATNGECVLVQGTYCPPANAGQACGAAGDTCQVVTVAASSGSTGGGEQTSATTYTYGHCEPPAADAGEGGDDDASTSTSNASDSGSGTGTGTGASGSADAGAVSTGVAGDAGTTSATPSGSGDDSSSGCTIAGAPSTRDVGGAFALVVGTALVLQRRRRAAKQNA